MTWLLRTEDMIPVFARCLRGESAEECLAWIEFHLLIHYRLLPDGTRY